MGWGRRPTGAASGGWKRGPTGTISGDRAAHAGSAGTKTYWSIMAIHVVMSAELMWELSLGERLIKIVFFWLFLQ